MIKVKFAHECNARKIEDFELKDYKEFFDFYISHWDKGIIISVNKLE